MAANSEKLVVDKRLETIFAQAVGLAKSEIYVYPGEVLIVNTDGTAMLRFECPGLKTEYFAFKTEDYDSNVISVVDGEVSFITKSGTWTREKTPEQIPKERGKAVKATWDSIIADVDRKARFTFSKEQMSLIDDRLSHMEISAVSNRILILQRDIYSGAITRIWEDGSTDGLLGAQIRPDFGPVALRTSDFTSLFSFQKQLTIDMQDRWAVCTGPLQPKFEAIIGACTFDEINGG